MNGRDDTTTFLPLDFRIGGQNRDSYPMVGQCLTRDQTIYILNIYIYIYIERERERENERETGELINMDMVQQEKKQER